MSHLLELIALSEPRMVLVVLSMKKVYYGTWYIFNIQDLKLMVLVSYFDHIYPVILDSKV